MANDYTTPGGNVAGALQDILARKRAESRQGFLDKLTQRSTESEIAQREALGGYYGKLGTQIDENITNERLKNVAPGTPTAGLSPAMIMYMRSLGMTGEGPRPQVTTTTDFMSDDATPITETSAPDGPGPEVFLGDPTQRIARQQADARGAYIADPNSDPNIVRSLMIQAMGGDVPDAAKVRGSMHTVGPTGKTANTGVETMGGNQFAQLGFNPADSAAAAARIAASRPEWKPMQGRDPQTGLPQNYFVNVAGEVPTAVPTFIGDDPARAPQIDNKTMENFLAARTDMHRAQNPSLLRIEPNAAEASMAANTWLAGVAQNASPPVREVLNHVLNNPQVAASLAGKTPMEAAALIGRQTGMNVADQQQLAQYLTVVLNQNGK